MTLKQDDVEAVKRQFGFDPAQTFVVPQEVYDLYSECAKNGKAKENDWNNQLARYAEEYPAEYAEFVRRTEGKLPDDLEATLPE